MLDKTATVITPAIGREHLRKSVQSVQQQTYGCVEHYIVVDGAEFRDPVQAIIHEMKPFRHPVEVIVLPQNTGMDRYHGYRICAGFAYLTNAEVLFFLDDDNWYDPEHIEMGMQAIYELDAAWSFSLRRICSEAEQFLVDDDCDSLGFWRRHESYSGDADFLSREVQEFNALHPFLVDTNCYAVRAEVLMEEAPLFVHHRKGDAYVASNLVRKYAGACTGQRTVNYRVRTSLEPGLKDFFQRGNAAMLQRYRGALPWHERQFCRPFDLRRLG